ncbi:MAG: dihydropteroate synthase [Actinomycetota bacterium]
MKLRLPSGFLPLDRVAVMGVLNVTPDSFSDGGLWLDPDAAIRHGIEMVEQGAAIVDVGGESTRPGAVPVPQEEELRRVIPVVEALSAELDAPVSIDTRKPEVARRAVEAGASIVNDTAGEEADRAMDDVVIDTGAAVVVMHSRGTPSTMRSLTDYDDVVADVSSWLRERAGRLEDRGAPHDAVVLDPGFGFAKTPPQNLEILSRIDEFLALGHPLLVGTSRKSFIGAVLDLPEGERVEGTMATVAWAVARGAQIVRVHDVVAGVRTARMVEAIRDAR